MVCTVDATVKKQKVMTQFSSQVSAMKKNLADNDAITDRGEVGHDVLVTESVLSDMR